MHWWSWRRVYAGTTGQCKYISWQSQRLHIKRGRSGLLATILFLHIMKNGPHGLKTLLRHAFKEDTNAGRNDHGSLFQSGFSKPYRFISSSASSDMNRINGLCPVSISSRTSGRQMLCQKICWFNIIMFWSGVLILSKRSWCGISAGIRKSLQAKMVLSDCPLWLKRFYQ